MSVLPQDAVYKFLRNGAERNLATANGSPGTPINFDYVAPAGKTTLIRRSSIKLVSEEGGSRKLGISKFINGDALTNGLFVQLLRTDGVLIRDFMDGSSIRTNGDLSVLATKDVDEWMTSAANQGIMVRWTLTRGRAPALRLPPGYIFRVVVRDDLTSFQTIEWQLQGELINPNSSLGV